MIEILAQPSCHIDHHTLAQRRDETLAGRLVVRGQGDLIDSGRTGVTGGARRCHGDMILKGAALWQGVLTRCASSQIASPCGKMRRAALTVMLAPACALHGARHHGNKRR
jgi:hypothetical protein